MKFQMKTLIIFLFLISVIPQSEAQTTARVNRTSIIGTWVQHGKLEDLTQLD